MRIWKAFRYRLYPTREQEERLEAWEHALRFLWNVAHEQRLIGLRRERRFRRYPTAVEQMRELTELRSELPWLADVPRHVCGRLLVELDLAWQRCFKKLAKAPRWKRKGRDSVTICETDVAAWRLTDEALHFPKLGALRAVVHRPLQGTAKTCALVRDGDQWFCAIACELELPEPTPPAGPPVALDRGVVNLVADSNGRITPNPRFLARGASHLARAQRVVARRQKGSQNQHKAKKRVARLHRRIRRQRDHFLHQLANTYAHNHGAVIVERLQIGNMTRSAAGTLDRPGRNVRAKSGLNRSILDGGWGRLVVLLRHKVGWAGGRLIEVPAAFSSQTCARCNVVDPQSRRSQALFVCTACGHQAHADVNAAAVLLSRETHGAAACRGLAEVGQPAKQELRAVRHGRRIAATILA